MLTVILALPLFALPAAMPPLSVFCLSLGLEPWPFVILPELLLLPFAVGGVIYAALRLCFVRGRGSLADYMDYRAVTWYVSLTVIACYTLMLLAALLA